MLWATVQSAFIIVFVFTRMTNTKSAKAEQISSLFCYIMNWGCLCHMKAEMSIY